MGNLKKLYGRQANCSGINNGIFGPKYGNFWREAKTKRLFSLCTDVAEKASNIGFALESCTTIKDIKCQPFYS
jgi:hypothetical protein